MTLRAPADQDLVVVGASGDLAARKLLPALYNLSVEGLLPAHGKVVGFATADWDDAAFRNHAREAVRQHSRTGLDDRAFDVFAERLRYVATGAGLAALKPALGNERRLVYLAVPASAFTTLITGMGSAGLAAGTSVIIEKPFGRDLASARALNVALHEHFPEPRIFRIDHYLGKETVQNLLVFRFGNSVFERIWNRDCVEQVEITVAEELGVEQRGAFYEETGAIRDIVQNHLFQLLSILAMEPPISFEAEALRDEKVKLLRAVRTLEPHEVIRGQYVAGVVDGQPVPGYTDEPGVAKRSTTETFAALCVHIDNWRWAGVPFLLRTGKRMARRETAVILTFRSVPLHLFEGTDARPAHNRLRIRVQPDEGIDLDFEAKRPGPALVTGPVRMDFSYGESFKTSPPEAYERLLHDALLGDHTLFIREDEVERGWAIVEAVLEHPGAVHPYPAGSWGPKEVDTLARRAGWHEFEPELAQTSDASR
ncbi:MAG TPA: glucose-6-phosphate dehydrogenase [Candidatus Dormibacteraeota bacterium]